VGGADECSECAAGKRSGEAAAGCSTCNVCGTGKYKIADCTPDSETYCGDCPKNTFTISGAADINGCEDCPAGGHSQPGAGYCDQCLTGKYYDETNNKCELCPKNTFTISGAADINGCEDCPAGGHSQPGSGYCDQCLTGKYYNEPTNVCKLCPKNTFTISGATDINGCEECPPGGHSQPGSGYCDQCLSGKYYEEEANDCKLCPAGTYTATGGVDLEACITCDDGFYSSDPGSATCLTCAPGKFTNADQTECLLCPAGKISGVASSECAVCEIGKFAENEGSVECKFCNDEDVLKGSTTAGNSTASKSGCICDKGEYENHETATCEKVMEGVREDKAGMNVTTLDVKPGFWRTSPASSDVMHCLGEHHCAGGNDPENSCEYGYEGPLCAVCSEGFASVGSGADMHCNVCEGSARLTIAVGFITIAVVILGIVFWCCRSAKKRGEY
jgi:hypothetical protein